MSFLGKNMKKNEVGVEKKLKNSIKWLKKIWTRVQGRVKGKY